MGKKKRKRKTTVFGSIEGKVDEGNLLEYLKEIYTDINSISFPDNPNRGGDPNHILSFALKNCHYDRSFAWIDEDKDLSQESREKLARCWNLNEEDSRDILSCHLRDIQARFNQKLKKPVLLVSQPVCVESLILKILGKTPKHLVYDQSNRTQQINDLKNAYSGVIRTVIPVGFEQ